MSSPGTLTFNITLPQGGSVVDTTLGSGGAVSIGAGANIQGPLQSAGGLVEIQPQGAMKGITAGGNVKVDDRATVTGNIRASSSIAVSSSAKVSGTSTQFAAGLSPFTTTWSVTNPGNSQGGITLQNGAIAAPSPNVYDAVVVNANSSLYLSAGTYFFQSLDLESGANLFVDSSHGPVFLYISSNIIFRGHEKNPGGGLPSFFVGYFGTSQAILEMPFNGVFLAPNAPLSLQNGQPTVNVGTFYGQSVNIAPSETIKPGAFDWTEVPGMPAPPGGFAAHGGADGTGDPGSGATGGGTGVTGSVTPGSLPLSAVRFHLASQPPDPVDGPGITPATTASVNPAGQVPFHVPAAFDVGGVLANGTVTLTYTSCTGQAVTCTYHGGSTSDTPATDLDLEAGRTATLATCSDGQPATALRCGTNFNLAVQASPRFPVTVDLSLDDRACGTKVDLLTPLQTRQMIDSFSWPNPQLQKPPLVTETSSDGKTPMLYYAWVYLHNTKDLLLLRQLYVHILSGPLFTSEFEAHAGQCVQYQNQGDGFGTFVPVLMPGKVYNTILNVQNVNFQKQNNLQPGDPLFKAVILRSTTPIDFQSLRKSGFRYLDYEGSPIPSQTAMRLQGGAISVILQNIETFALQAVQDVANFVTMAIGDIDALFASRVNYKLTMHIPNINQNLVSSTATRAWGKDAGMPLGAGGLKVTLYENLLGIFPETFTGYTDDHGSATIQPAANGSGVLTGYGFCVTLQNDGVWATSFLLPNMICNLGGFDKLIVGVATQVSSSSINIPDFSQDRDVPVNIGDLTLNAVYGMTDAFLYSSRIAGYSPPTAHVLVGDPANVIGGFHDGRAFTYGLHQRNESDADLTNLVTPYVHNLLYAGLLDTISTGGGAGLTIPGPIAWLVSTFANTDIVMPDAGIEGRREVGEHEYGHYILLSAMHDEDVNAIDDLIGDTIFSGNGNNNNFSTRYLNEAFADFISGQTTSIANYGWLSNQEDGKVCVQSPCFDNNFANPPSASNTSDKAGIARGATLLHDGFDGHPFPSATGRNVDQPDNADAWFDPTLNSGAKKQYTYTSVPYDDNDGPDPVAGLVSACRKGTGPQVAPPPGSDAGTATPPNCVASESVTLPGSSIVQFAHVLEQVAAGSTPFLTDQKWFTALDQTMFDAGYSWCQRCQVLALHVPENVKGGNADTMDPMGLLKLCWRPGADTSSMSANLANWQLPAVPAGSAAPDPQLRLDATTCQLCPPNKFPDSNGQCNVDCPADFVVDGATAPLVTLSEKTTATGLNSDSCPGEFIVEIDNPNQFFARGATSVGTSLSVDSPSQQTCDQSFSITFADQPGTTGFVPEQTVTDVGSFQTGSGQVIIINPCGTLPAVTLTNSQLTHGSAPIRFLTPAVSGVTMALDIGVPSTTPQ